jgi:hypothetical protein
VIAPPLRGHFAPNIMSAKRSVAPELDFGALNKDVPHADRKCR